MTASLAGPDPVPAAFRDKSLITTMAIASGVAVANIYYNQPMLADMARSLKVTPHTIGLVATATQIGYAAGMPVFIPLGDFIERRRLVTSLFILVGCSLCCAALATNLLWLTAASFAIGVTTVIAQVLIPFATELVPPAEQGRTVGTIMTGVLLGILLARTLSGIVAGHFGWRTMFWLAAATSFLFAGLLRARLPLIHAHSKISYPALLRSIGGLIVELPKLRQVSLVAAMFLAAFSGFWTTLVFLLERAPYHFGAQIAGLFGLIGAAGAFIAPVAGRLADRRSTRYVVGLAILTVLAAFAILWIFGLHLWGLIIGVIVLDAGVQAAQVANQTRVLSLRPEARNRVNTVYMVSYFTGGSLGSFAGSWAWGIWGWNGVCLIGIAFMLIAGILLLSRVPAPDPVSPAVA